MGWKVDDSHSVSIGEIKKYTVVIHVFEETPLRKYDIVGASVYMDGNYQGDTDTYGTYTISNVPEGTHTFKATDGETGHWKRYGSNSKTVKVTSDMTVDIPLPSIY